MIVNLFPLGDYAAGTYPFGPVAIADDVTSVNLRIQRCTTATPAIWPLASVTLQIIPEIEINGVWQPYAGGSSSGGIVNGRNGSELTHTVIGGYVTPGTNRRFRGVFTIAGSALRSQAEVELL